jgi:hypothetical protein
VSCSPASAGVSAGNSRGAERCGGAFRESGGSTNALEICPWASSVLILIYEAAIAQRISVGGEQAVLERDDQSFDAHP